MAYSLFTSAIAFVKSLDGIGAAGAAAFLMAAFMTGAAGAAAFTW